MSSVSFSTFVSARHVQDIGYCMITLATCFTVARFTIRGIKRQFYPREDVAVSLAWACLVAMCVGYILVTPAVYRIAAVGKGEAPVYPTIEQDAEFLVRIFFPNTLLLWSCLWLVKAALLFQCRRLIERQPRYILTWWCIAGFTAIVFLGCVISEFTSCRTLHDWFTFGQCSTARDARASSISLYYAFAVDILTDFMIMAFPVRILWALHLSPIRKLSIIGIFCVGIIAIIISIIRVVQIGSNSGARQPSPSWLEVWAMIEGAIAVVVSCLPTFGLLFPKGPSRTGYGRSGDTPNPNFQHKTWTGHDSRLRHDDIALGNRSAGGESKVPSTQSKALHGGGFGFSSGGKGITRVVDTDDSISRKTSTSEQQLV